MLLVISFKETVADIVAKDLQFCTVYSIHSSLSGIEFALKTIRELKPSKVLGVGSYSGVDRDNIRLEKFCSDRFRNVGNGTRIPLNNWARAHGHIKPTTNIGNSWCNKLSWEITNKFPDIPYSFLHIPKTYSKTQAVTDIQLLIDSGTKL